MSNFDDQMVLGFDEPFNLVDNCTIMSLGYDTEHGNSEYCDENNRMCIDYEIDNEIDNEMIKELRNKLIEKMGSFYY